MIALSRRSLAIAFTTAVCLASPTFSGDVFAQPEAGQPDKAQINLARQAASEGLQAYRNSEFEKALNLFEQAKALYPSAQIVRMIGYSLLALERWMPAAESMEAALESTVGAPLGEDDKKDVREQLAKAMVHIGVLNVTSTAPGAKLSVDGGAAMDLPLAKPLRMAPGKHKVVVTAPEHEDAEEDVEL